MLTVWAVGFAGFLFWAAAAGAYPAGGPTHPSGNLAGIAAKARGLSLRLDHQREQSRRASGGTEKTMAIPVIPLETTPYWSSQTEQLSLWGVALADLKGDGYPEVITCYEQGYNYIYANNHGVMDTTPSWVSNDWDFHIQPAVGDYDNDGDLDLAVASYQYGGGRAKAYRNDGGSLTTDPVWTAQVGGGTWCDWGDFNNDGRLDLAVVDMFAYPMVFRNNNGVLEDTPCWTATDYNIDFGGAWGDLNNDGWLDLMVGGLNGQEPLLRVYFNHNGTLETTASWRSQMMADTHTGIGISVGDVDRDGWLDVAVACGFIDAENNVLFKNLHDTLEGNPSWSSSDASASGFSLWTDLNNDGYLDWAVNNGDAGVCYENDGGSLGSSYSWSSASVSGGLGIDVGDVNQDGVRYKEDTLTGNGAKKLFYLSLQPIQKMVGITVGGVPVPLSDYCYHLQSGWVSFKNAPPSGSRIIFKYNYSMAKELLLSDYAAGVAHLFRNTSVGVEEGEGRKLASPLGLKLYPNPFVSFATIPGHEREPFDLYDISGRHVGNCRGDRVGEGLAPGVYFLSGEDKAGRPIRVVKLR
jgi:hypothetical protein